MTVTSPRATVPNGCRSATWTRSPTPQRATPNGPCPIAIEGATRSETGSITSTRSLLKRRTSAVAPSSGDTATPAGP